LEYGKLKENFFNKKWLTYEEIEDLEIKEKAINKKILWTMGLKQKKN
jgi:hypothetical protein